ncbi:MAG: type II secretion system GspH family protein [Lentisphaeraceae bacterium]|nr:type II secretion system GspH family protein [Lentisphaeraceae bacterium]
MEKNKKFTLIELLVVIAILGILASILAPSLSKARNATKHAVCINSVKQLALIMQMYADDHNSYYTAQSISGHGFWTKGLITLGYFGDDKSITLEKMQDFYGCPVREMKPRINGDRNSWGINSSISNWVPGVFPVTPMSQFREPSELFSFIEMQVPNADQDWGWLAVGWTFDETWNIAPHNRRSVIGHADGHVSSYSLTNLLSTKGNNTKWVP